MDKLTPPEALSLDGNIADNWRCWKQQYEIFALPADLVERSRRFKLPHSSMWWELKLSRFTAFTWETDVIQSEQDNRKV